MAAAHDRRIVHLEIKAAGPDDGLAEGEFEGYASVFGNIDSYGDVVRKGAFVNTLQDWKDRGDSIPVLWGHDMMEPESFIGVVTDAAEDDHGLRVKCQLDVGQGEARTDKVYRLLKGRRVSRMSFAYDVIASSPGEQDGVKVLYLDELRLYEVSVVPVPANPAAEVLTVKASTTSGVKEGRTISAATEAKIKTAIDALTAAKSALSELVKSGDTSDHEKTSAPPVSGEAADQEEPARAAGETNDEARQGKSEESTTGRPSLSLDPMVLALAGITYEPMERDQ